VTSWRLYVCFDDLSNGGMGGWRWRRSAFRGNSAALSSAVEQVL